MSIRHNGQIISNTNLIDGISIHGTNQSITDKNVDLRVVEQFTTMPNASSAMENRVVQYIGTATQDFTTNYVYKCLLSSNPHIYTLSYTSETITNATVNPNTITYWSALREDGGSITLVYVENVGWQKDGITEPLIGITLEGTPSDGDSITVVHTLNYIWERVDVQPNPTIYESFFRGKYTDWAHTPTDPSAYLEDFHGNTTPLKNDYIVVTDASAYVNPDFSDDPENVAFQRSPNQFTINITVGNNTISVYYNEINQNYKTIRELFTSHGYTDVGCEWLKLKYIPGAPGVWNITSTSSYYENNELVSANTDHFLMNTSEPVTSMFYLSKDAGVAPIALFGGWRFRYVSEWSDKGKNGWKPEYQVEDVLPIASPTEQGIAKLYTTTGSNTDGTMDQNSITTELGKKQDVLTAGNNITIDANSKIDAADKTLVSFVIWEDEE